MTHARGGIKMKTYKAVVIFAAAAFVLCAVPVKADFDFDQNLDTADFIIQSAEQGTSLNVPEIADASEVVVANAGCRAKAVLRELSGLRADAGSVKALVYECLNKNLLTHFEASEMLNENEALVDRLLTAEAEILRAVGMESELEKRLEHAKWMIPEVDSTLAVAKSSLEFKLIHQKAEETKKKLRELESLL